MASRKLKQRICRSLQWQLQIMGQTNAACSHSCRVIAWPGQHQLSRHLHTEVTPTGHVSRLLSVGGFQHGRPGHATRAAVRATRPGLQGIQARAVSMVSKTEYIHPPVSADNILRNPLPDIHIPPELSLHQMVFDICDKYKDRLAVEDYIGGRSYTYSQLKEAIVRVASALYRKGYRKGDVLCAFAANNVDYTVLAVACAATGVWFSAANPAFTPEELARQLHHCEAKCLCISAPLAQVVRDALGNQEFPNQVKDVIVFGEASGFEPIQNLLDDDGKAFPDVDIDPVKDVFALPYSSGTTGLPKGVMLSHHNIVANVFQISKLVCPEPDDRCLGLLPLYHIYGMVAVQFISLMGGSSITYLPKFDPEVFLKCLHEKKITVAYLVPPLVLFLAKHPVVSKFDLSAITEVLCGAAPLGEELCQEFLDRHPNVLNLRQGFGMTETSPVSNIDMTRTKGSVGHMMPNTRGKIVDLETEQTLPTGQLGEFWLKGPQVMLGYFRNQAATDDMITKDGWIRTGDIGYFNEDGAILIKDRLKELIKYKGSQVAPAELEALLLSHPDIQDVAVVGVPDEAAGELPRAFVVVKPGASITEEQVANFVEGKVSKTKKLRGGVQFLEEIPKNPSGKILRRVIKEKYL